MSLRGASVTATGVLLAAVVVLLVRRSLLANAPIAIGVQVLAVALMVAARVAFGTRSFHAAANPTEGGLVTRGPYRFIRHPIYAAILMLVWAGVLSHASVTSLSVAALATATTAVRIAAEERLVVERYPEYKEYATRTKRLIPFVF